MKLDQGLVVRACAGDDAAAAELMQSVWPDAYRVAWSVLADRTAAEDAAQEACARAWSSLKKLRRPEQFAAWFYRIVINESRRIARAASCGALDPNVQPEQAILRLDERLAVRAAIAALEPRLRATVVLRYYYRLRSREIAQVLGASAVTVRWWLMLAHRRLARTLDDRAPHSRSQTQHDGRYGDESITAS